MVKGKFCFRGAAQCVATTCAGTALAQMLEQRPGAALSGLLTVALLPAQPRSVAGSRMRWRYVTQARGVRGSACCEADSAVVPPSGPAMLVSGGPESSSTLLIS
jgi:hypothetical protein